MLRTLRKHNKWILVVGGSLLMVTFLISGSAKQLQPNPAKQAVATIRGEKVTAGQMQVAAREFELLKDIVGQGYLTSLGDMKDVTAWFLASQEAARAGLVGGPADGIDWLPAIAEHLAPAYFRSIPAERLQAELKEAGSVEAYREKVIDSIAGNLRDSLPQYANRAGLSEAEGGLALAKLRGIERMFDLTLGAPRLSTARLAHEAANEYDQATINAVILPAEPLAKSLPEPTPEELQKQFDAYRAVAPGGEGLGFGYLQPPRVKIAWLTIDRQAIASAVQLDPVAVNKHWQQNRTTFTGEFSAERPKIEALLRNERAEAILGEIDRVLKARVNQATRSLDIDGARKVLPPTWAQTKPSLEALASDLVVAIKEFNGVTITAPTVTRMETAWVPVADLGTLPGVGSSVYSSATARLSLPQLVSRVHELSPKGDSDLQAQVPYVSTPLIDQLGNRYYIEVIDARQESAPASIDEVREQVVRDARLSKAYERLSAEAPEFRVTATLQGLDAVANAFEARFPGTDITPMNQILVTRTQVSFLAQQLNDVSFRDAVMDATGLLPPTAKLDETNVDARTIAKPVPAIASVVVAQIVQREPVTMEFVRAVRPAEVIQLILKERVRVVPQDKTFTTDAISQRLQFVEKGAGRAKKSEAKDESGKGEPGKGETPATAPAGGQS